MLQFEDDMRKATLFQPLRALAPDSYESNKPRRCRSFSDFDCKTVDMPPLTDSNFHELQTATVPGMECQDNVAARIAALYQGKYGNLQVDHEE